MSARIARPNTAFSTQPKPEKNGKDKGYLAWLHEIPCIITGTLPVEAAHLSTANPSYGHTGRAKSKKAEDRWALPLCKREHDNQHFFGEHTFWNVRGVNPYVTALVLHGLYLDGVSAEDAAKMLPMIVVEWWPLRPFRSET